MDVRIAQYGSPQLAVNKGKAPNSAQPGSSSSTTNSGANSTNLETTTPVAATQATKNALQSPTSSFQTNVLERQRLASDAQHLQDLGRGTKLNIVV